MSAHPADHEEFLERLATGEVDPRSDAARERLASCEVCAREHEGFERLALALDAAAAEEREALSPDRELVAGEDRVAAMLARARDADRAGSGRGVRPSEARGGAGLTERPATSADEVAPSEGFEAAAHASSSPSSATPERRSAPFRWLALAAAMLAVALFAVRAWNEARSDAPQMLLGDGEFALSSPSGDLRVGGELRLDYRLPADGRFSIVFEGVTDDGRPWRAVRTTSDERWTPPQELLAEMPARVTVRAIAIDASGRSLAVSRELSLPVSR